MPYLTSRVLVRPLATGLVVGIVLGLGFLGVASPARSAPELAADPSSKAAVIQAWIDARNRSDEDAAAALLADNVFYIGNPNAGCNPQVPCYDRASVQQSNSLSDAASANHCYTMVEVHVAGNVVTGRADIRSDPTRNRGIERTITAFMAEVVDGKVAKIVQFNDTGDSQTALSQAIGTGTAPPGTPLPTPDPPCA